MNNGSLTMFGKLMEKKKFRDQFDFLNIDEVHCVKTIGTSNGREEPFRRAWGRLRTTLLRKFNPGTAINCLSATLDAPTTQLVIDNLGLPDETLVIRKCLNRHNLTYAVRQLTSNNQPWLDLKFMIPYNSKDPPSGHHLVFINNCSHAVEAVKYLDKRLHPSIQSKDYIKVYHSQMSKKYLEETLEDFKNETGKCKILISTSALTAVSFFRSMFIESQAPPLGCQCICGFRYCCWSTPNGRRARSTARTSRSQTWVSWTRYATCGKLGISRTAVVRRSCSESRQESDKARKDFTGLTRHDSEQRL